jgi:tellurite resistance protein TehA-like permease
MKPIARFRPFRPGRRAAATGSRALLALLTLSPGAALASEGAMLDTVADVLTWIVLIVAPIVGIAVFLLIHILPEKIAEKRHHPQLAAIKTLCLLSLVFGGMLWPLAWLWAYTKPVLYRIAYGTDTAAGHGVEPEAGPPAGEDAVEIQRLRARIAELEATQLAGTGKA